MSSRRTATSLPLSLRDDVLSKYLGGFHAVASKFPFLLDYRMNL